MAKKALLWLLSVAAATLVTTTFIKAQQTQSVTPQVLAGEDFGFRVEGVDRSTGLPAGRLVVRMNDEWVEVRFQAESRLLSK